MMHGKKSPAAAESPSIKASSTTVSPAAAPRQLPPSFAANGAKLAPPTTSQSTSTSPNGQPSKAATLLTKKSILLADIPPFNPAKAAARQAELAAQKAAKDGSTAISPPSASTSPNPVPVASGSALTPQAPKSKISATAAPFVFKPNPNASTFTPGSSTARKPSVPAASPAPSPKPQPQTVPAAPWSPSASSSQAPPPPATNPFFGTKPLKRAGSSSLNVKEDFTPFRLNAVLPDPAQVGEFSTSLFPPARKDLYSPTSLVIVPSWPFTGKPYRSMYPPQSTPLSLADEQSAAAAYQNAVAMSGLDPSASPAPQPLLPPHHPQQMAMHPSQGNASGAPPPPPPGAAAAAVAMGMPYPGMNVHPQQMTMNPAQMQAAMAAGMGASMQMYGPPPQMAQQQGQQQGGQQGRPNGGHAQQQGRYQQQQHPGQMGFVPQGYHLQAMGMGGGPQMFGGPQQQQGNPHSECISLLFLSKLKLTIFVL